MADIPGVFVTRWMPLDYISGGASTPKFEFENGRLVKINGMRPEYMDGHRLVALIRYLAETHEQGDEQ